MYSTVLSSRPRQTRLQIPSGLRGAFSLSDADQKIKEEKEMGAGKLVGAGFITWVLGGGFVMFVVVLLLLKAC